MPFLSWGILGNKIYGALLLLDYPFADLGEALSVQWVLGGNKLCQAPDKSLSLSNALFSMVINTT